MNNSNKPIGARPDRITDALLLGNGINRLSQGPSWEDLLVQLYEVANIPYTDEENYLDYDREGNASFSAPSIVPYNSGDTIKYELDFTKPFPLLYEELLFRSSDSVSDAEQELKEQLNKHLEQISPSPLHDMALNCGIKHILTTNYDLAIEKAAAKGQVDFSNTGTVKESRFSLFRKFEAGESTVWHMHGDMLHPNSIMLGYEQYAGYLQAIRQYAMAGASYSSLKTKSVISRVDSKLDIIHSWVDLFFSANIHIIGLSFDLAEIHLWWILTYQARIAAKNKKTYGRLFFYLARQQGVRVTNRDRAKLELLESFGVEIVEIGIKPRDHETFYKSAFDEVAKSVQTGIPPYTSF